MTTLTVTYNAAKDAGAVIVGPLVQTTESAWVRAAQATEAAVRAAPEGVSDAQ